MGINPSLENRVRSELRRRDARAHWRAPANHWGRRLWAGLHGNPTHLLAHLGHAAKTETRHPLHLLPEQDDGGLRAEA